MVKLVSFFSGIGAPEQALKNLNINHLVRAGFEINARAIETYQLNHGTPLYGFYDIKEYLVPPLWDQDIFLGGPVCKSFSQSGKKEGLNCENGELSELYRDAINVYKPKTFVWENSPNFIRMVPSFADWFPDYCLNTYFLNAKNYGSALERNRFYAVGIRKDVKQDRAFYLPDYTDKSQVIRDVFDHDADKSYLLSDAAIVRMQNIEERAKLKGYGYRDTTLALNDKFLNLDANYGKGPDGKRGMILDPNYGRPRMATIIECKRLQGFPDDFKMAGPKTEQYRQLGNAMNVNVLEVIFRELQHFF